MWRLRAGGASAVLVVLGTVAGCGLAGPDTDSALDAVKVEDCRKTAEPPGAVQRLAEKLEAEKAKNGASDADVALAKRTLASKPEEVNKAFLWSFCMIDLNASCEPTSNTVPPSYCEIMLPGGFLSKVPNPFVGTAGSTTTLG